MKQLTLNGKVLGVVDVPEYAIDPWIINNGQEKVGVNWYNPNRTFGEERLMWSEGKQLPPGQWVIMGRLDSIIGEQAAEIRSHGIEGNPLIILKEAK